MQAMRCMMTVTERASIELRLSDGWGIRAIARSLGRSAGTISDEVGRHGGRQAYRAASAQAAAMLSRARCRRRGRLVVDGALFGEVARLLRRRWSPEQIAGRRARIEEGVAVQSGLSISHEAIYAALYALPRGELRRELLLALRQDKPMRGRRPKDSERRGKLCDITNIRERPDEVAGRLVPGHWEGDLILGAGGRSAIGTLVERSTRFVLLVRMPARKTEVATSAFAGALNAIPAPLRQTLTYDQGKEMAAHRRLAEATGMRIFFADPHSPWQRGSNENTNGLLRQYFPKGTALSAITQIELDAVANELNERPRKTLAFDTPKERFDSLSQQTNPQT